MSRFLAPLIILLCTACQTEPDVVVLATTTSVANSGLLDRILPAFEEHTGIQVRSLPVGSGRALRLLAQGQADVVISHAPGQEAEALREHPDWWYRKVFFNDFLIAGPRADGANVASATDAVDAMRRIQRSRARFVSRGDESGTHEREQALWSASGTTLPADRLIVAGQGMGGTLRVASEMDAYTLTDRGTFEQLAPQLRLVELHSGDPRLLNTYATITGSDAGRGGKFAVWLADGRGRDTIAAALASGDLRGFRLWPEGRPRERPEDIP